MRKIPVRAHLRRLSNGTVVRVRAHVRRLSSIRAAPGAGGVGLGPLLGLGAALLGLIVLVAFCSAVLSGPGDPQPAATATAAAVDVRVQLAQGLREARERTGLSVADAGIQAGMSRSRLAAIEDGARTPRSSEVDALCRVYRLDDAERNALMELQWRLENGDA